MLKGQNGVGPYIVNFGIAPFLRDRHETEIKQASHYVLLFDESFNKHLKMIQMDVHIRFWSNNGVESVYFDSFFWSHEEGRYHRETIHTDKQARHEESSATFNGSSTRELGNLQGTE